MQNYKLKKRMDRERERMREEVGCQCCFVLCTWEGLGVFFFEQSLSPKPNVFVKYFYDFFKIGKSHSGIQLFW